MLKFRILAELQLGSIVDQLPEEKHLRIEWISAQTNWQPREYWNRNTACDTAFNELYCMKICINLCWQLDAEEPGETQTHLTRFRLVSFTAPNVSFHITKTDTDNESTIR